MASSHNIFFDWSSLDNPRDIVSINRTVFHISVSRGAGEDPHSMYLGRKSNHNASIVPTPQVLAQLPARQMIYRPSRLLRNPYLFPDTGIIPLYVNRNAEFGHYSWRH